MGATAAIAGLAISAAATSYSAYETSQTKAPKLPKAVTPNTPKLPDSGSLTGNVQAADEQARSAGGTILAQKKKGIGTNGVPAIDDGANTVRKSLLGT